MKHWKHWLLASLMATSAACGQKKAKETPALKPGVENAQKPADQKPGDQKPADQKPADQKPAGPSTLTFDRVERATFNLVAARLNMPLFWVSDANTNKTVDPAEVVSLLFYDAAPVYAEDGVFTQAFTDAYEDIVKAAPAPPAGKDEAETNRIKLMWEELDQGRPTLVYNKLKLGDGEKKFVEHMQKVAALIDQLYERQKGLTGLYAKIPEADAASRRVFARNRSVSCEGPKTEKNPACRAIPGVDKVPVDVYPAELQKDDAFCGVIEKHADAKLRAPFTVVRPEKDQLVAVPYTQAYSDEMTAISTELKAAAAALDPKDEAALIAYLGAAAVAFTDNKWEPVDEKWAAMNGRNSKWYVRVAPDETYWEPCNLKAGFHLTFSRINPDFAVWQDKLNPVRQDMENELARLAGAPYKARTVNFAMPDFIDIVLNAGDDRDGMGATIGQSLPNWGPVANEGRGRTIVMANLYTDPDSMAIRASQAQSLFTRESLASLTDKSLPGMLGTILHEATHNLGPSHEYKVKGKKDDEVFGGALSTTLEELKAQTGALHFINFLVTKNLLTADEAKAALLDAIIWSMGHISRGMYTESKNPKPYSQLAAIHVGYLMDEGAIEWKADAMAANGTDKGAFVIHLDKFPAAIEKLMTVSARIKATGDKAGGEKLVKDYVDEGKIPFALIAERWLRHPKSSFVYALDVE
jgi:hypothetical protein